MTSPSQSIIITYQDQAIATGNFVEFRDGMLSYNAVYMFYSVYRYVCKSDV